jgi:hypothetical protein
MDPSPPEGKAGGEVWREVVLGVCGGGAALNEAACQQSVQMLAPCVCG